MRVLVNELTAIRQKTGIGHYAAELLAGLRAQADKDDIIMTYPGRLTRAGMAAWTGVRGLLSRWRLASQGRQSAWKGRFHHVARSLSALHFRAATAGRSIDLYHEPNYIPLSCAFPTIATIHDLSVLLYPEWHPADRVRYYERHFVAGLARCARLLAVSEFTRRELVRHFGVPASKIAVTHNGIRPGLRRLSDAEMAPVRARLGLPSSFLLHVGTMEPRKNLGMLLGAYVALPNSVREKCQLVLAGGWGWNVGELARQFDIARQEGVIHLGYVTDRDLPALYSAARGLVFPSFYEGFGLPPVEMLACGGAVLASTAGAVAETVGGQAHLIDPFDQDGWRAAMLRLIEDDEWQHSLQTGALDRVRRFTWDRCAARTWQVYRDVASDRSALSIAA